MRCRLAGVSELDATQHVQAFAERRGRLRIEPERRWNLRDGPGEDRGTRQDAGDLVRANRPRSILLSNDFPAFGMIGVEVLPRRAEQCSDDVFVVDDR